MTDVDERGQHAFAGRTGFGERQPEFRVDVTPPPPRRWETSARTAFNPTISTIASAVAGAHRRDRHQHLAAHPRPPVVAGRGAVPFAVPYLLATQA